MEMYGVTENMDWPPFPVLPLSLFLHQVSRLTLFFLAVDAPNLFLG